MRNKIFRRLDDSTELAVVRARRGLRSRSSLSGETTRLQSRMAIPVGFTLVELLVVIAIIGILSSVAVINLNSARDKAKEAAVLGWLDSIQAEILLCLDNGNELLCDDEGVMPCTDVGVPTGVNDPTPICDGSSVVWLDIDNEYSDWSYDSVFTSSSSDMTWVTSASNLTRNIRCTENGCVVTTL
jgi:prepilin-type N-terminal cleavage/methylation domain-containing protein